MMDERFDRDYQAGRAALNQGIDHLVDAVMASFRVLSSIQFDAPWQRTASAGHCPPGAA